MPPWRPDPVETVRSARVHRKSHRPETGYSYYLKICLTGPRLEDAGFLLAKPYETEVSRGELVLPTV